MAPENVSRRRKRNWGGSAEHEGEGESVERYSTRSAEDVREVEKRGASWVTYDVAVENGWQRRDAKWKGDASLLACDVAPKTRAGVSRN